MPCEALLVSAGRLWNCWPLKGPLMFQLASWLAVEPLALKRGVGVAVDWPSCCPAEQRAIPCGAGGVAASWLSCRPAEQRAAHREERAM
jgi:hypothetical protein